METITETPTTPVTIAYRIPGIGWKPEKTFKTEAAAERFVDRLIAKHGNDLEVRWSFGA